MRKIKLEKILELRNFLQKWCEENIIDEISYTQNCLYPKGRFRLCSYRYIYQDDGHNKPQIDTNEIDIGDIDNGNSTN